MRFSGFLQSQKLYFSVDYRNKKVNVIMTFIYQGSFHINSNNITGHQSPTHCDHLWNSRKYLIELKLFCLSKIFPEFAQNSLIIPWVFHVRRNPRVLKFSRFVVTLGKITQNNGHYAVQGQLRSPILVSV